MSNIVHNDLGYLYSNAFSRISMGLKPSGPLHLGTSLTILQSMIALKNSTDSSLDITIMDLDFDFQRGADFISYMKKHDIDSCHTYMREHTFDEVMQVTENIASFLQIDQGNINISYFSDIEDNKDFQDYKAFLFGTREGRILLKSTVVGGNARTTALLSPICPDCGHSSTHTPRYLSNDPSLDLEARCYNDDCLIDKYQLNVLTPRTSNFFYLVDPIRDLVPNEHGDIVDLHVFGGDYGISYGNSSESKASRCLRLLSSLSDMAPSIYIGPIITDTGRKLGKSMRNDYSIKMLSDKYPNWMERLYTLLLENPDSNELDLSTLPSYFR